MQAERERDRAVLEVLKPIARDELFGSQAVRGRQLELERVVLPRRLRIGELQLDERVRPADRLPIEVAREAVPRHRIGLPFDAPRVADGAADRREQDRGGLRPELGRVAFVEVGRPRLAERRQLGAARQDAGGQVAGGKLEGGRQIERVVGLRVGHAAMVRRIPPGRSSRYVPP
jgi:hypothetical protein